MLPSLCAQEVCKICFESYQVADMACARCKHYYCKVRQGAVPQGRCVGLHAEKPLGVVCLSARTAGTGTARYCKWGGTAGGGTACGR